MRLLATLLMVGTAHSSFGIHAPALAQGTTSNTLRLAEGNPRPAAKVADPAWLAGRWTAKGSADRRKRHGANRLPEP